MSFADIELFLTNTPAPSGTAQDLFNELRFGQRVCRVAWSAQNIIAWVLPKKKSSGTTIEILKPFRKHNSKKKQPQQRQVFTKWTFPQQATTPSMVIETDEYHSGNDIVNVVFNQLGNGLASIDRTGKIVVWTVEEFINEWKEIWNVDVKEPVVAFWWLATERKWEFSSTGYRRAPFKGPRNRYGNLAFVVVTSSGKVLLYYQQEKAKFLSSTAQLDVESNSVITHADYMLNNDGRFILSTYNANSLSQVATIFEIFIDLLLLDEMSQKHHHHLHHPQTSPLQCWMIANVDILGPNRVLNSSSAVVDDLHADDGNGGGGPLIHMKLFSAVPDSDAIRMVLVTAQEEGNTKESISYNSHLTLYEFNKSEPFLLETEENKMLNRRTSRILTRISIQKRLITHLWQHQEELLVGFDNGNFEFRRCSNLDPIITDKPAIIANLENKFLPTPSAWGIRNNKGRDKDGDNSIAEVSISPNGTVLLCARSSGKVDFFDIADTTMFSYLKTYEQSSSIVELFARLLTLSILNNVEHTDLENVIVKLALEHGKNDFIELVLENTLSNIEGIFPTARTNTSSDFFGRLLGVQLSLFKTSSGESIQYLNALAFLQLRAVDAAFRNSYVIRNQSMIFSSDALLSLLYLTSWVVDFAVNLVRNLYEHYFSFPKDRKPEKSHLTLLYNSQSRTWLKNVLQYVSDFRKYIASIAGSKNIRRMRDYLEKDILEKRCPIKWDCLLEYVSNVTDVIEAVAKDAPEFTRLEYSAMLRCTVPRDFHTTLQETENLFKTFVHTFKPNVVYFYKNDWAKLVDVVNKARDIHPDRQCTRCGSFSSTHDHINSRWSNNYVRSCVCGGFWRKLSQN
ncbi:13378_t:CDS:10 [Ambispora leptoticha]|uniref:Mediator of RNA polymerase II transcription subunit 16 n=1 Tax=Ambispora leptoticha TaxID=144679 RepID=A0A9N9BGN7_9GLOM|nr:13378_t:CDS:10 [Ambispora leptoticha]